jgi:hypothetical protein
MPVKAITQKSEGNISSFTMRLALTNKMQGREKNILNQAWVNATLKID